MSGRLLAGYIINKFRGDVGLFDGGIAAITVRTGLRCYGVVPYFSTAAFLPAEDSLALAALPATSFPREERRSRGEGRQRVAVPLLPRIANFDDLDPLRAEPRIDLFMVRPGQPLPRDASLIILPGSKATISDLEFLRLQGWDIDLLAHRRHGGRILGICGGYQMLGRSIADPAGMEGRARTVPGLGLLDIDTVLTAEKRLGTVSGVDLATGLPVAGYEMHLGSTTGPGLERPMLRLRDLDGCVSADGKVAGCYLHGLFASDRFRRAFVTGLGAEPGEIDYEDRIEAVIDALADHLEESLDTCALLSAARVPRIKSAA